MLFNKRNELEYRQIHGYNDKTHGASEENHQHWFHHRRKVRNRCIHLIFIKISYLGQHCVKGAR
jgi:hypothetical protein